MRRYNVKISLNGHVVHVSNVTAVASDEAKDEAWREFDPAGKIDLFDTSYDTLVEEADA